MHPSSQSGTRTLVHPVQFTKSIWYLFGSYAYMCGSGVSVEFIKALHGVILPNSFLPSKLFPGSSKYFLFPRVPLSCPPARELVLSYVVPVLLQLSLPCGQNGRGQRERSVGICYLLGPEHLRSQRNFPSSRCWASLSLYFDA